MAGEGKGYFDKSYVEYSQRLCKEVYEMKLFVQFRP